MPFITSVTGSFFAGRRSNAFSSDARLWDPSLDITAAIWFDASDTSSYTLSGSNVTAVTDKAGNATVTVNGTPNISNTLDGKNVWTFESGSTEDLTTDEVAQTDGSGNHWAIGVMQWNFRNDTQDSFWSTENNSGSILNKRDYAISAGASGFDGELDLDGLATNRISSTIGNKQDFDSGIAQNTWVILVAIFNKSGNQIAVRVDGDNAFTPVNDYDNSLDTNMDLRIFRNRANERMSGQMAEFFTVADVPGTGGTDITDVQKAEGYIAHKWGLEGSLPVGHPYKSAAPSVGGSGGGAIQSATSLSGTAQIYGYTGSEQTKGIYLDPTGTRFTQLQNGTLYEWIMSPALDFGDLQQGSETNTTTLTNQGAYMFEDSGNLMFTYVAGSFDTITKYSLSTAYDTSTLSSSQTGSLNSSTRNTVGLKFYNNGSNLVVMDDYFSGFRGYDYYTLTTPYDLSTMSSATTKIYPGTSDSGHPLYGRSSYAGVFNNDGSRLYLTGAYKRIMVVELGTAYEIDSATSYVDYDYTSTVDDWGLGLAINAANDKLYLYVRDFIVELALG